MTRLCGSLLLLMSAAAALWGEVPSSWNVATGENVLWTADLGSYSYAGPVAAGDVILVGTNNDNARDPSVTGDRGVLLALRREDGALAWQAVHEKLEEDLDYPLQGLCSTPTVEGDRVYYLANDAELVCVDLEGFRDGENDGPLDSEERTDVTSADYVWRLDLHAELGVVPHFMSSSTPAIDGDLLFVHTSNGASDSGDVPAPDAPSFLAVDRHTGRVVWSDARASAGLLDGQWSSPVAVTLDGRRQVLFGGGDGRLYALDPGTGAALWTFDANAAASPLPDDRDRNVFLATPVVVDERIYVAVGRDPELGSAAGGLWALRGEGRGDVGREVADWVLEGETFGRSISNVAIEGGVVYAADLDGFVVAVDAVTGNELWRYDALAAVWATPVVIEGRLFVADVDGDIAILEAGRELRLLEEISMPSPVYRAPVRSGEMLLVLTGTQLFALQEGAGPGDP